MKEKDKLKKIKAENVKVLKDDTERERPHPVDEASMESFPASDPPPWTPTRAN